MNLLDLYNVEKGTKEAIELERLSKLVEKITITSENCIGKLGDAIISLKDGAIMIIEDITKKENKFVHLLSKIPPFPHWLKTSLAKI